MTASHDPRPFRPGRAIEEGRKAGKRFGVKLARIIDHLDTNCASVATAAGLDHSTIVRICAGQTAPKYETFYAVVQAIHAMDRAMGIQLARELYDLCQPEVAKMAGDYNEDGREDIDDLVHAVAFMLSAVDNLMMMTLKAIRDNAIDNTEFLNIMSHTQSIRDHSNRFQRIAQIENDKHSRRTSRRG